MGEKQWVLSVVVFGVPKGNLINYLGTTDIKLGPAHLGWDLDDALNEALEELGVFRDDVVRVNMRLINDKDPAEPHHHKP